MLPFVEGKTSTVVDESPYRKIKKQLEFQQYKIYVTASKDVDSLQ